MNLSDLIVGGLREGAGLDREEARELAAAIINWGAEQGYSGDRYYWPVKMRQHSAEKRNESIRREFDGRNLREVCQRHGVSHSTVYRALQLGRSASA